MIPQETRDKDENFANGRFARNFFEKVIEAQANRLSSGIKKCVLDGIVGADVGRCEDGEVRDYNFIAKLTESMYNDYVKE